MSEHDPNELHIASPDSPNHRRDNGGSSESHPAVDRPYADAGNLYEIPRVRPDDPPMRQWWTDDDPQQDGSGSQ